MYFIGHPILALVGIADMLIGLYILIVIAAAVVSWVNPDPLNPIVRILHKLTEPALAYLRRYIPSIGDVDITPIVLIIALEFIRRGIFPIIMQFAISLIR